MTRRSCSSCWSPCPRQYTRSPNICDGRSACYGRRSEDEVTRRMSAILGEYSPAGQGCTRHFSVPPLEYKNSTSYKKYRPNFGLNIQESYGKRPMDSSSIMTKRGSRKSFSSCIMSDSSESDDDAARMASPAVLSALPTRTTNPYCDSRIPALI